MADEMVLWHYTDGDWRQERHSLVPERPLALFINGRQIAVIMRLPGLERELALGYCYDEGLLVDASAVQGMSFKPGSPDELEMLVEPETLRDNAVSAMPRLVMAVAGVVQTAGLAPLVSSCRVTPDKLLAMPALLDAGQVQRRETGGTHAAGLFSIVEDWYVVCEDIGRHNAVDKCVGTALLTGRMPEEMVLLCTGRLSYEMVAKVVRARIPIICTLAVPTALAVSLAGEYGITLVSRLDDDSFRVHAHPERITGWH